VRWTAGSDIGRYRLVEPLGAGGMGVVFKAIDTTLGRPVALKFLPDELEKDQSAIARFTREARAASALNHPHICSIYEIGEAGGAHFIAMEYVDGQPLSSAIAARALDLPQAVRIALEVAEALAKAHEAGIVHRDVKPANILLAKDGYAKLVDFGIAKLREPEDDDARTKTTLATGTGLIVGTTAYMSPEQARGEAVDRRADIFSLGLVLFEMLTRQRSLSLRLLSPYASPQLAAIIEKATERDPADRYQTAAELAVDLRRLQRGLLAQPAPSRWSSTRSRRARNWLVAGLAAAGAVAVGVRLGRDTPEETRNIDRTLRAVPLTAYAGTEQHPTFSPDGSQIAFSWDGEREDNADIYVKVVGPDAPLRLTREPSHDVSPAWSPDGRQIAFVRMGRAGGKIGVYVIPALGGVERRLTEFEPSPEGVHFFGPFLAWSRDGQWLVLPQRKERAHVLVAFSLATGERRQLTGAVAAGTPIVGDSGPALSPDGGTLAFHRIFAAGVADIFLQPLDGGFTPAGAAQRLTSENRLALNPVWSPDGRTIFFTTGPYSTGRYLARVAVPTAGGVASPERLAVGEDARSVAISKTGQLVYGRDMSDNNIWRLERWRDAQAAGPSRVIASTRADVQPRFSPDGQELLFASERSGQYQIWLSDADGANQRQLTAIDGIAINGRWSPDGASIVFDARTKEDTDVYVIGAEGGQARRLTTNPSVDHLPSFSRDGRWIYFASDRTGSPEVWRMPFEGGTATQVTRGGGHTAVESPDGRRLVYSKNLSPVSLWHAPVTGGDEVPLAADIASTALFVVRAEGVYFAVRHADGTRSLRFASLEGGTEHTLRAMPGTARGFDISPDGRWLFWEQIDQRLGDLMLVEEQR
jgi:Tol biopolymer transport system component/aminoglycoside phosphotransferase (APT) family kinase protein